jgi:large subunit ribosomal protein L4e
MKNIRVYDLEGNETGKIERPKVFDVKPRKDLIVLSNEVIQSQKIQPQGRDKYAGLKNTAEGWGTGHGLSRAPRIKGSGFPTAKNVGKVPFARGGRQAHPIKSEKNIHKKINKKTKKKALLSAISASGKTEWIKNRGHRIKNVLEVPLVVDDKIQTIKKTSVIYDTLCRLGLEKDLKKAKENYKKIRSGKGKRRGRKYKKSKSILIVVKEDFGIFRAARNIPGVDVIQVRNLSVDDLAPGGLAGRLVLWTESAFKELNNYEVYP